MEYDYVALGDSYAAMGSRDAATGPEFCLRSTDNYPSLVAADERVRSSTDVTCQGARIPDLLNPRPADSGELAPQLAALGTDTDLVTLSIGGNDLGFGEIIGCVQENLLGDAQVDCAARLEGTVRTHLAALPEELDELYRHIEDYSGGADVIATGYLPILPEAQTCPEVAAISPADREWAGRLTAELNGVLTDAAERNGASFVLPAGAAEHSTCAEPGQRWTDITGQETGSYPMHPTAAGQAAMAEAVLAELRGSAAETPGD
ncbi:SGNH/GDSL hydrolase family protein [Corynebacterium halotolerans]|uniref:SGNH/GDSL hydrolase family protein n=1 Tax=Corynebacterium halotolerans TaxID=225326 RepID=UPI003CFA7313